jgi:hypothetical protein
MKLAEEFNVAVYLTNQVVSDPAGAMTFVADPKVSIQHEILYIFFFKKKKQRFCRNLLVVISWVRRKCRSKNNTS